MKKYIHFITYCNNIMSVYCNVGTALLLSLDADLTPEED